MHTQLILDYHDTARTINTVIKKDGRVNAFFFIYITPQHLGTLEGIRALQALF